MQEGQLSEVVQLLLDALRRAGYHLRRTPGMAAVSLLIGVALWVLVTDAENPTRVDVVPIAVQVTAANIGPQLAVANALPALQLRISAPADRWDRLSADSFRAFVDLNGLGPRAAEVPVRVEVVGLTQVRVLEVIPSTITVNLEELVTKPVKVTSRVVGTLPRGYDLTTIVPDRATADVSGPKSLVALVSEVSATVNVTGLTTPLDQTIALTATADGGGEIRGVTIRPATAKVAIAVRQNILGRTLPLEVDLGGQPAPGYRITGVRVTPTSVRVEGPIDLLQGLDTLRLPRVDLSGQQADVRQTVRITTPEGMATTTPSAVVEVTIAPIVGSTTLTLAPEVSGVRSGFLARVSPGSVTVTLEGPLARLNALQPNAVRATVDAAGLQPGTTDARVVVAAPDGVTVREVQPASVSVTLTRP
jgi:YbbR domain-containing protein